MPFGFGALKSFANSAVSAATNVAGEAAKAAGGDQRQQVVLCQVLDVHHPGGAVPCNEFWECRGRRRKIGVMFHSNSDPRAVCAFLVRH